MSLLVIGLVFFLVPHLVPVLPGARTALARVGEQRYKAAVAILSAGGLISIVVGYYLSQRRDRVFAPISEAVWAARYAVTLAMILMAAGNLKGHIRHVLKHPMLLGLLIWSVVHLLANGDLKGTVLFASFGIYAAIALTSRTWREPSKQFEPMVKHDVIALLAGTAVALGLMALHRVLFGVKVASFGL